MPPVAAFPTRTAAACVVMVMCSAPSLARAEPATPQAALPSPAGSKATNSNAVGSAANSDRANAADDPNAANAAGRDDNREHASYVGRLAKALAQDASYKVRLQAAVLLGRSGSVEAVVPLLTALVQDPDSAVRLAACGALAALHDPRAIAPLVQRQALDSDPSVRDAATHALSAFPREQALPYVMVAYGSDDARVRKQVLFYISTEPSPLLEPVLISALGDAPEVFQPAAAAFHALPGEDALRILSSAASNRDPSVRRGAVVVLRQMQSPQAAMEIREVYERDVETDEVRDVARRALRDLRRYMPMEPVVQAAANPDRHVRSRALKLLGVLGGPQAEGLLMEALKSDDPYIRGTAVWALTDLGSPDAVPTLEQMLKEPSNERILPLVRHALKVLREQPRDASVEAQP